MGLSNQNSSALSGSFSGSAQGYQSSGSWYGAVAGGILGGVSGYLTGGKKSGLQYDQSFFDQRSSQIDQYANNLSVARSSYLTSLGNMYNDAYARYTLNAQPQFANHGLQVNSGAFAQSLAYKSADYSAQLAPMAYDQQIKDLNNVDSARQALFGSQVSTKYGTAAIALNAQDNTNSQMLGAGIMSAIGAAGSMYKNNSTSNPSANAPASGWGQTGFGTMGQNAAQPRYDSFGTQPYVRKTSLGL